MNYSRISVPDLEHSWNTLESYWVFGITKEPTSTNFVRGHCPVSLQGPSFDGKSREALDGSHASCCSGLSDCVVLPW